jgi:hypothetical protein
VGFGFVKFWRNQPRDVCLSEQMVSHDGHPEVTELPRKLPNYLRLPTTRPKRQRKMIIVASRGPGIATNSTVRA